MQKGRGRGRICAVSNHASEQDIAVIRSLTSPFLPSSSSLREGRKRAGANEAFEGRAAPRLATWIQLVSSSKWT